MDDVNRDRLLTATTQKPLSNSVMNSETCTGGAASNASQPNPDRYAFPFVVINDFPTRSPAPTILSRNAPGATVATERVHEAILGAESTFHHSFSVGYAREAIKDWKNRDKLKKSGYGGSHPRIPKHIIDGQCLNLPFNEFKAIIAQKYPYLLGLYIDAYEWKDGNYCFSVGRNMIVVPLINKMIRPLPMWKLEHLFKVYKLPYPPNSILVFEASDSACGIGYIVPYMQVCIITGEGQKKCTGVYAKHSDGWKHNFLLNEVEYENLCTETNMKMIAETARNKKEEDDKKQKLEDARKDENITC